MFKYAFFGSAMLNPHIDGGFSQYVAVRNDQIVPYDNRIPSKIMVFAEPLAVAVHAVNQAGSLVGKKVLVTGCGPIGSLVVAACKKAGAVEIVASDIQEFAEIVLLLWAQHLPLILWKIKNSISKIKVILM